MCSLTCCGRGSGLRPVSRGTAHDVELAPGDQHWQMRPASPHVSDDEVAS